MHAFTRPVGHRLIKKRKQNRNEDGHWARSDIEYPMEATPFDIIRRNYVRIIHEIRGEIRSETWQRK